MLLWMVVWEAEDVWEDVERVQVEAPESRMRFKVPRGYLEKDRQTVQKLVEKIRRMGGGQEELYIYMAMMDVMNLGLV